MMNGSVLGRCVLALLSLSLVVVATGCDVFKSKKNDSVTLGLSEDGESDLAYTFVPVFNSLPYATNGVDLKNPGIQFTMDMIENFAHFAYVECRTTSAMSANLWAVKLEQDAVIGIDDSDERVFVNADRDIFLGYTDENSNARPAVVTKKMGYPCTVMPQRFLSAPTVSLLLDSLTKAPASSQVDLATAQFIYLAMRGYEQKGGRGLTNLQQAYIKIATNHSAAKDATSIHNQLDALDRDLNPCSDETPSSRYSGDSISWRNKNFRCFSVDDKNGIRGYAALTNDFPALRTTVLKQITLLHTAAYGDVSNESITNQIWSALTYSGDMKVLAASEGADAEAAKLLLGEKSKLSFDLVSDEKYRASSATASSASLTGFNLAGNPLGNPQQQRPGQGQQGQQGQQGRQGQQGQQQRFGQNGCPNNSTIRNTRTSPGAARERGLVAADTKSLQSWQIAAQQGPKAADAAYADSITKRPTEAVQREQQMRDALTAASQGKIGESNGMKILGIRGQGTASEYAIAEYKSPNGTAYAYQTRGGQIVTQEPAAAASTAGQGMSGKTPAGATNFVTRNSSTVYDANKQPIAGTGVSYDARKPTESKMFAYSTTADGRQTAEPLPTTYNAATHTVSVTPGPDATRAISRVASKGTDSAVLQKMEDKVCQTQTQIKEMTAKQDAVKKAEADVTAAKAAIRPDGVDDSTTFKNLSDAEAKLSAAKDVSKSVDSGKLAELTGQQEKDKAAYFSARDEANAKLNAAVKIGGSGIAKDKDGNFIAVDKEGKPVAKVDDETAANLKKMNEIRAAADGRCSGAKLTGFSLDEGCNVLGDTKPENAPQGSGVGTGAGSGSGSGSGPDVIAGLDPNADKKPDGADVGSGSEATTGSGSSTTTGSGSTADTASSGTTGSAGTTGPDAKAIEATDGGTKAADGKPQVSPGDVKLDEKTSQDFDPLAGGRTGATTGATTGEIVAGGTTGGMVGTTTGEIGDISTGGGATGGTTGGSTAPDQQAVFDTGNNGIGDVTRTDATNLNDPFFQATTGLATDPAATGGTTSEAIGYGKEGGLIGPELPQGYVNPAVANDPIGFSNSTQLIGAYNSYPELPANPGASNSGAWLDPAYTNEYSQGTVLNTNYSDAVGGTTGYVDPNAGGTTGYVDPNAGGTTGSTTGEFIQ